MWRMATSWRRRRRRTRAWTDCGSLFLFLPETRVLIYIPGRSAIANLRLCDARGSASQRFISVRWKSGPGRDHDQPGHLYAALGARRSRLQAIEHEAG